MVRSEADIDAVRPLRAYGVVILVAVVVRNWVACELFPVKGHSDESIVCQLEASESRMPLVHLS
jgi:hypothetical protein